MRRVGLFGAVLGAAVVAGGAQAQQPSGSAPAQPSIEELMRKIDALQHRVDELESRDKASAKSAAARHSEAAPVAGAVRKPRPAEVAAAPAIEARTAAPSAPAVLATATRQAAAPIPGLRSPEPMGSQIQDALRSDLPGLAIHLPSVDADVRVYGFAKVSAYKVLDARNQTDTPPPHNIPLVESPAYLQGGDYGMTARFSRIGVDTRRLTDWGTFETRVEGDFGGGNPNTTAVATFRLRQAWAEIGTDAFRMLIGQANSLWNEGLFETLNDATNLNQSFVRQAQVRATAQLASGLTGSLSLEAPETQYTAVTGVFTPVSSPIGGLSPAFNSWPDLLGRLTYRYNGLEMNARGLARDLEIRTAGTAAEPPAVTRNVAGWGVAGDVRFPMRWISEAFGPDMVVGMSYYGEGIGRYFAGNTWGQDAISNVGLPEAVTGFDFEALPTYGAVAAYRRFWMTELRSTVSYAYARQEYPSYALQFNPGTFPATSLNSNMEQVIANLIWSPFAQLRNGAVDNGWLDMGLEYMYTRRNVFGGSATTAAAGAGYGVANRFVAAGIARF